MNSKSQGRLLVLEGLDGSGKTSVWNVLRERAAAAGRDTVFGTDPGGTALGRRIRTLLLNPDAGAEAPSPMAELLLYLASRAQLVREVVSPALAAGRDVVLDRYWLSTLAYQGLAGLMPPERLRAFVLDAVGDEQARHPDSVVWLKLPAEEGWRRLGRARTKDRIESRGLDYLRAVEARYVEERAILPPRVRLEIIDATRPPVEVAGAVEALWFNGYRITDRG